MSFPWQQHHYLGSNTPSPNNSQSDEELFSLLMRNSQGENPHLAATQMLQQQQQHHHLNQHMHLQHLAQQQQRHSHPKLFGVDPEILRRCNSSSSVASAANFVSDHPQLETPRLISDERTPPDSIPSAITQHLLNCRTDAEKNAALSAIVTSLAQSVPGLNHQNLSMAVATGAQNITDAKDEKIATKNNNNNKRELSQISAASQSHQARSTPPPINTQAPSMDLRLNKRARNAASPVSLATSAPSSPHVNDSRPRIMARAASSEGPADRILVEDLPLTRADYPFWANAIRLHMREPLDERGKEELCARVVAKLQKDLVNVGSSVEKLAAITDGADCKPMHVKKEGNKFFPRKTRTARFTHCNFPCKFQASFAAAIYRATFNHGGTIGLPNLCDLFMPRRGVCLVQHSYAPVSTDALRSPASGHMAFFCGDDIDARTDTAASTPRPSAFIARSSNYKVEGDARLYPTVATIVNNTNNDDARVKVERAAASLPRMGTSHSANSLFGASQDSLSSIELNLLAEAASSQNK